MEHEQPCTHTHTIYTYFFWGGRIIRSCFLHRIRIIFLNLAKLHLLKLAGQLSIATWGKFSAREPGKVQDIEDAFRLSDLPFHYHRLSLALPNICICSTCWKKTSLIGTVYECWFPLDFPVLHWLWALERAYHCNLRCFLSHSWNLHSPVTMQVGKGQILEFGSFFFQKLRGFCFELGNLQLIGLTTQKANETLDVLFHCCFIVFHFIHCRDVV